MPIDESGGVLQTLVELREENARLRRELESARKALAWAAGKVDAVYEHMARGRGRSESGRVVIGKAMAGLSEHLHVACGAALAARPPEGQP